MDLNENMSTKQEKRNSFIEKAFIDANASGDTDL